MSPTDAAGWIPVLSSFLAFVKTNSGALGLLALVIALFGLRIGPKASPWFEIHGFLYSFWVGAQNVGLVGAALGRIEAKLDRVLRRYPDSDAPPPTSRAPLPSVNAA